MFLLFRFLFSFAQYKHITSPFIPVLLILCILRLLLSSAAVKHKWISVIKESKSVTIPSEILLPVIHSTIIYFSINKVTGQLVDDLFLCSYYLKVLHLDLVHVNLSQHKLLMQMK